MDNVINNLFAGSNPRLEQVELVGPTLRLEATFDLRHCSRLTDFLNAQERYAQASDVRIIGPQGTPISEEIASMQVSLADINFVAQRVASPLPRASGDVFVPKTSKRILATTSGHMINGLISLYEGADLDGFIRARDPQFVPLRHATVHRLSSPDEGTYYDLVLVNRSYLTSAGEYPVASPEQDEADINEQLPLFSDLTVIAVGTAA